MKKSVLQIVCAFVCVVLAMPATMKANENLLKSSSMDAKGEWMESWLNSAEANRPSVQWGYAEDKPASAEGGVLRVSIVDPADISQYCIYQEVTLVAGKTYNLDAAFKGVNGGEWVNTWVEAFIHTSAPVDGEDFGSGATQLMNFSVWNHPTGWDGTFSVNAHGDKKFTPNESGKYYFACKVGCNGGGKFELLLDNISLTEQVLPVASFTASARSGFAPLAVTFTSTSLRASTYEWNFGDGGTSNEANPSHTYNAVGSYTVSLKVTNEYGESSSVQQNYIEVKNPETITGGGVLQGGNMEDAGKWKVTTLNSPTDQPSVATWNYRESTPAAGQGGALRIQITAEGENTVQYCIYQTVTLDAEKVYRFNAAFRDLSPNLWHYWAEVYIGNEIEPADGADFGGEDGVRLVDISNWEDSNSPNRGLNGTFKMHGNNYKEFVPTVSGEYYFVFKTGIYAGGGNQFSCDIVIDELLLEEVRTKPYTDFTAENNQGFNPLEVSFINNTKFANSYLWDFGDGSTATEQNPKHTYNALGQYTVSLKAVNEMGDSTIVKTNYVSVNERPQLPDGEKLYGGNMENSGYWYHARIGGASPVELTWNYTENTPAGGENGALRMQAAPPAGQGSNIALFQPVRVKKDHVYTFDCLFKVIGSTNQMWLQVFVIADKPEEDREPESGSMAEAKTLGQLNTWADASVTSFDGRFSEKALIGGDHAAAGGELLTYHHTGEDADLYFVLKVGTWDHAMDIVIDNLSLKEETYVARPKAGFSSDITMGDAPLEVQFFNESENASTFHWEFGDGNTSSEEDPLHVYTTDGTYTVSLTVTNGHLSDKATIQNMIQVGASGIEAVLRTHFIRSGEGRVIVTSDRQLGKVTLYDVRGNLLETVSTGSASFTSGNLLPGLYILNIEGQVCKVLVK